MQAWWEILIIAYGLKSLCWLKGFRIALGSVVGVTNEVCSCLGGGNDCSGGEKGRKCSKAGYEPAMQHHFFRSK